MNTFIRLLYAILLAVSVVTFIGVAIFSLYQPPKYPDYPRTYSSDSVQDTAAQKQFDKLSDQYTKDTKNYHRNVSYILLPLAVIAIVGGLYLFGRSEVIGEGVALGGVATSVYAIITTSIADARVARLIAVTVLLAGVIAVVQRRFRDDHVKAKA